MAKAQAAPARGTKASATGAFASIFTDDDATPETATSAAALTSNDAPPPPSSGSEPSDDPAERYTAPPAPAAPGEEMVDSSDLIAPEASTPTRVKRSDIWWVRDKTATTEHRTHEPVAGIRYDLSAHSWAKMPSAHAMVFLRDAAFEVKDDQHKTLTAMPSAADRRNSAGFKLQPGEVVAHIDELTTEALMARAVQFPGGRNVRHDTPRANILSFLGKAMLAAAKEGRGRDSTSTGGNSLADSLLEDDDELARRLIPND